VTVALLDVNVLLALIDPDHVHHTAAHAWFTDHDGGWATCAITQNGFVRVSSQSSYPNALPVAAAMTALRQSTSMSNHEWWSCDISLVDGGVEEAALLGPRQVTDAYLLALAVHHGGVLVTLDQRISPRVVRGAQPRHLAAVTTR